MADRWLLCQPVAGCRARIASSAVVKAFAHGQLVGIRSVGRPLRLTIRPAMVSSRVRTVRATTSWFSTRTLPVIAVQRIMLWARTAHCNQALLAWKLPEGMCSRPALDFPSDRGGLGLRGLGRWGVELLVGQW